VMLHARRPHLTALIVRRCQACLSTSTGAFRLRHINTGCGSRCRAVSRPSKRGVCPVIELHGQSLSWRASGRRVERGTQPFPSRCPRRNPCGRIQPALERLRRPLAVWLFFADVQHWKDWNAGIERIQIHGPFAEWHNVHDVASGQDAFTSTLIAVKTK